MPEAVTDATRQALARDRADWRRESNEVALAVAKRGAIRLTVDGAPQGTDDDRAIHGGWRLLVVEEGPSPRVVAPVGGVRLLVHVDPADVQPVVVADARVRTQPDETFADPPRRGHATLRRGAWIEAGDRTDGAVAVRYRTPHGPIEGWLADSAVGTAAATAATIDRDTRRRPNELRSKRATTLRTSRAGKETLVEVAADQVLVAVAPARGGWRLVQYEVPCEYDFVWTGWVRTRDVFKPDFGRGYACDRSQPTVEGSWGDLRDQPRTVLPAGQFLVDVQTARLVGCVVEDQQVADVGGGVYGVATPWGPVRVRLASDNFDGECGAHSSG